MIFFLFSFSMCLRYTRLIISLATEDYERDPMQLRSIQMNDFWALNRTSTALGTLAVIFTYNCK